MSVRIGDGTVSIDEALARYRQILAAAPPEDDRPIGDNEASTRLHLIDPILIEVLGWPRAWITAEIKTAEGAPEAGRLDYLVREDDGFCWFVVEAKKRTLALLDREGHEGAQTLKLSGPVLKRSTWPVVESQMAEYLGRYQPLYGVLTNGEQWVAFLGSDTGVPLDRASAVVFRSPAAVINGFDRFYEFLSFPSARRRRLQRELSHHSPRGFLHVDHPMRVVPVGEERVLGHQDREEFYEDLRRAIDLAFDPVLRDKAALARCFVESPASREADSRLARIAAELEEPLRDAHTHYPPLVQEQVAEVEGSREAELPSREELAGQGYLVRLLGEPSAGKSVFLRRLFDVTLADRAGRFVLLWINGQEHFPFDPGAVGAEALRQIKTALFGPEGPTWDQYRAVHAREWAALMRLQGEADGDGESERRRRFVDEKLAEEARNPDAALPLYLDFIVRNRRRLPCLVVDNVDSVEQAEAAMRWALSLHLRSFLLTTIAVQDATLWRLRPLERDPFAAAGVEQFWLPRPRVGELLRRRCAYLKEVLTSAAGAPARTRTRLGRNQQWQWRVDADDLVRVVSDVLLAHQEVSNWIGEVSNFNFTEMLQLCRRIVLSPHVRAEQLLSSQVTRRVSRFSILKALIAPGSEQYRATPDDPVMNVLGFWHEHDWVPLLPARLLGLLRDREDVDRNHGEPIPGFMTVDDLVFRVERLGVPALLTRRCIGRLRSTALIESYDPACADLEGAGTRVKITPRGRLHLTWACTEPTYLRLMAEVDPLASETDLEELRQLRAQFLQTMGRSREETQAAERAFVEHYASYLVGAADRITPVPGGTDLQGVSDFDAAFRRMWLHVETN